MQSEVKSQVLRGNVLAALQSFKMSVVWNLDDVQKTTDTIIELVQEYENEKCKDITEFDKRA
tara:strand:+ start:432 stop:617 length:186 start_codon:yes stop_codon:yes gene_type:complete